MSDLVVKNNAEIISNIVLKGDLSGLSQVQKVEYYNRMCQHVGLDPVSQPFSLLNLSGKQVLYANKSATEQLRVMHGVSVTDVTASKVEDIYVVTAKGMNKEGRTDAATGAVNIANLKGDALANALMKAETKAKRRLTLSLCGLGMLDETEIDTIPDAKPAAIELVESELAKLEKTFVNPQTKETDVGPAPREYSGHRAKAKKLDAEGDKEGAEKAREAAKNALFQTFGPALDYRITKREDGTWTTIKIEAVPEGAGADDATIPF